MGSIVTYGSLVMLGGLLWYRSAPAGKSWVDLSGTGVPPVRFCELYAGN